MKIAFYTSTMGGAGHIAFALCIKNALERARFPCEFRMFGPEVPYKIARVEGYTAARLTREEQRSAGLAQKSDLARALVEFDPDLILVDMFWLPIRNILPMLRAEAWLLLHTVPRTWLRGSPWVRFDPRQYARIMATEPLRYHTLPEQLDPLVVCNPDECHPPHALKERLGVPVDQKLTLVVQTGMGDEVDQLLEAARADGEAVMAMSMRSEDAIFPIAPYLTGADRLIGGGGYHFFWEAIWLGFLDRTVFHPFYRTIDHQKWRVEELQGHVMRANGADTLVSMIAGR